MKDIRARTRGMGGGRKTSTKDGEMERTHAGVKSMGGEIKASAFVGKG